MMPCPHDTDGDGNCGRPACPYCGQRRIRELTAAEIQNIETHVPLEGGRVFAFNGQWLAIHPDSIPELERQLGPRWLADLFSRVPPRSECAGSVFSLPYPITGSSADQAKELIVCASARAAASAADTLANYLQWKRPDLEESITGIRSLGEAISKSIPERRLTWPT
jgi:hypothetical protein